MNDYESFHKIASLENECELLKARLHVERVAMKELDLLLERTFTELAVCSAVNMQLLAEKKEREQQDE